MERKKKILYVITKSVWGGAQRYVYDLATNLPRDRFEVTVVTGGEGLLVEKLREAGIRTIALETLQKKGGTLSVLFSLVNFRLFLKLIKLFREERPDIIHLNSSKVGGIGALAAWVFKRLNVTFKPTVVFTVHGWPFKEDRPFPAKFAIWFFNWISTLLQNKIILINTADLKTAGRFIPLKKLALIHNGIKSIDFLPRAEARAFFSEKIGQPIVSNELIVGTSAELTPNKGLIYLLRSLISRTTKLSFVTLIIGEGKERQRLERFITTNNLGNRVRLLGFILDAARYLKGLDIFILPSLKEGLPYTIMEAMQAGLPVIATRVGGIPDLIEHGRNGYIVEPKNGKELGEAIQDLFELDSERNRLGVEAEKTVKGLFSLPAMIEKTIKIYDSGRPQN